MILAEMWRKKMEAMNERERTMTMKGSLYKIGAIVEHNDTSDDGQRRERARKDGKKTRTLGVLVSRPCRA